MATGTLTTAGAIRALSGGQLKSVCTHIALYTSNPGIAGSHANEVAASNGYSRKAITWTSTGTTSESNTGTITFAASGNWGTVTHFGIVSNGTRGAGTMYFVGPLDGSRTMTMGYEIRFLAGTVSISMLTT